MTQDQVDALPMYQAGIRMGALSPDHTHLSLTASDKARFSGMDKWRKSVFKR